MQKARKDIELLKADLDDAMKQLAAAKKRATAGGDDLQLEIDDLLDQLTDALKAKRAAEQEVRELTEGQRSAAPRGLVPAAAPGQDSRKAQMEIESLKQENEELKEEIILKIGEDDHDDGLDINIPQTQVEAEVETEVEAEVETEVETDLKEEIILQIGETIVIEPKARVKKIIKKKGANVGEDK